METYIDTDVNEVIYIDINKRIKSNIEAEYNTDLSIHKNNSRETKIDITEDLYRFYRQNINEYMSNTQDWVGYVIDIEEDKFTSKLIDKKDPTTYEIASFSKEDVSDGDLKLIKSGAIFYWSIGYATHKGQRTKQSLIRFKRTGTIPLSDFDEAMDKAEKLNQELLWD